jgi:hypothetical protein
MWRPYRARYAAPVENLELPAKVEAKNFVPQEEAWAPEGWRSQWRNRLLIKVAGFVLETGKGGERRNEKKGYRGCGTGHDVGANV